jgi:predicted phage-related endonuclease
MNNYTYLTGSRRVRSHKGFHIGSSDIPIILGLTPTTPMDLWRQKTGREEGFKGNSATHWGNELEGVVLKNAIFREAGADIANTFFLDYSRYMYRRGNRWKPKTAYEPFTECFHPDYPWAMAHADVLYNPGEKIMEAKTGGFFGNVRREDMDGYDRKDPTASGVPFKVFFQVQWQQLCYDIPTADVDALINTNDFSIYAIDANKKLQNKLLEIGSRFMWCLENDTPPTPRTFGDIKKLFPELNNKRLTIMGDKAAVAWDLKERLKKAKAQIKKGEATKKDIENALALLIGEHVELVDEMGNKICSQSKWEQYSNLGPGKIKTQCPEAFELLDAAGMVSKSERRRINA